MVNIYSLKKTFFKALIWAIILPLLTAPPALAEWTKESGGQLSGFQNCVACHDQRNMGSFAGWPTLDGATMEQSVHALINLGGLNPTPLGVEGRELNLACWGCHSDGFPPPSAAHYTGTYPGLVPRYCDSCHESDAPSFGATRVNHHFSQDADPAHTACKACHNVTNGGVLPNTHEYDGAGGPYVDSGTMQASHYLAPAASRDPAETPWGDPNCLFCHEDSENGAAFGDAKQLTDITQHPPGWGESSADIPVSVWTYIDTHDSTRKAEGGYSEPDYNCVLCHDWAGRNYHDGEEEGPAPIVGTGPHGDYPTTSPDCKSCHAVHRSGGAFKLMRADSADDACSYCHVGSHRHATRQAYNGGSQPDIYAKNGHTIGAGRNIPDSSVRQWLEPLELTALADDVDEGQVSWSLRIRRYETTRMKMFVYTSNAADTRTDEQIALGENGGHHAYPATGGMIRYGPTLLTCMSCHQPHNASDLIWKPQDGAWADGYKLLRAAPAGSMLTEGTDAVEFSPNFFNGDLSNQPPHGQTHGPIPDGITLHKISAVDMKPGLDNTGHNLGKAEGVEDSQTADGVYTVYTQWQDPKSTDGTNGDWKTGAEGTVELSFWCADCHNLNIAGNGQKASASGPESTESVATMFRSGSYDANYSSKGRYHTDRTHTAGVSYASCVSCHRTNGDYDINESCTCHYNHGGVYDIDAAKPEMDFPHSGADTGYKLLFDSYNPSIDSLDVVCKKCHNLVGTGM